MAKELAKDIEKLRGTIPSSNANIIQNEQQTLDSSLHEGGILQDRDTRNNALPQNFVAKAAQKKFPSSKGGEDYFASARNQIANFRRLRQTKASALNFN